MERTLSFTVKSDSAENVYNLSIPNTGKLREIERLKSIMTGGQYGSIIGNRTLDAKEALDNVDMMANLTVICPDLIKHLKVNSWDELDPFDFKELKKAYDEQFVPWYAAFKAALRSVDSDDQQ